MGAQVARLYDALPDGEGNRHSRSSTAVDDLESTGKAQFLKDVKVSRKTVAQYRKLVRYDTIALKRTGRSPRRFSASSDTIYACRRIAGYSPDDIVGLADQDNENDEYHVKVPIVDVWMEYKRLQDMPPVGNGKWTQERIAKAKGVSRQLVGFRLGWADLPTAIINFFAKNENLKEGHAAEITKLLDFSNLSPWLDRDTAMLEVLTDMVVRNSYLKEGHFEEICRLSDSDNMAPWLDRETAMLEVLTDMIAKHGKNGTAQHFRGCATCYIACFG